MRRSLIIGLGLVAAVSIPVLAAQHGGHHGKGHGADMGTMTDGPTTRGDVETRVKTHFAAVDADKDGFIVAAEAGAMRTKHHAEMRDAHFSAMDSNKDGSISRAEFDAGHQTERQGAAVAGEGKGGHHMRGGGHRKMGGMMGGGRMFERADANTDGKVSLAEALAKPLARFDAADTNKDGTLTPEERKAARETMRAKWRDRRG